MNGLFFLSFTLFLLMDSPGNIPFYISFLKEVPPKRQRWIIFREMLIALGLILLFNFVGESLLRFLQIDTSTVLVAGGVILFILSLRMIFPSPKDTSLDIPKNTEPFIVPLAVPLVAGPAVLAAVILYSSQVSVFLLSMAIILAWAASLLILLSSPTLKGMLGERGVIALERLMGLILILIAVQMFLSGLSACFQPKTF